ncbi:hypothetical protein C1H46_028337 [Malus baccata]|uniref:Uncharacterized protein n=1 Tax=Malus baccata TaxID=106549 RepID=A0A540LI86_MALBA|nr:hypothetical protein C1H46_028337 [Malus baccata]
MAQSGFGQTTSSKQGGFIRSGLRGAQASERCGFTAGGGETMGCRRDLVAWRRCNGCDDGFLGLTSEAIRWWCKFGYEQMGMATGFGLRGCEGPLSETKRFNVLKVTPTGSSGTGKKAFAGI